MTNLLISDAWAQAGGGGGSSMFSLLPLALIFVLFYFLLIRPQQRRAKQHKQMVAAMKAGDEVATNGGLLGRVTDLDDNCVTLKVATGVNVQVQRHAIAQMIPKGVFKESDSGGKKNRKALASHLKDRPVSPQHRWLRPHPLMRLRTPPLTNPVVRTMPRLSIPISLGDLSLW